MSKYKQLLMSISDLLTLKPSLLVLAHRVNFLRFLRMTNAFLKNKFKQLRSSWYSLPLEHLFLYHYKNLFWLFSLWMHFRFRWRYLLVFPFIFLGYLCFSSLLLLNFSGKSIVLFTLQPHHTSGHEASEYSNWSWFCC